MIEDPHWPRSLSGEPLTGNAVLRYIFVDEAGTSETEPVTVVVGIVAQADAHVMLAERVLNEVLGAVPAQFREGFVFHATEIWNSKKYHADWRLTDRLALLGEVMRIPRRFGMAIAIGMVRQGMIGDGAALGLTQTQHEHFQAFSGCLAKADKYIREYANFTEVATVVAEDVKDMRRYLRVVPDLLTKFGAQLTAESSRKAALRPTIADQASGYIAQEADHRITRIRKAIHFVGKDDEPLIQLADACAFGMRRFFAGLEHGPEFAHAIIGGVPDLKDFEGPLSHLTYFFHPPKKQLPQESFTL